MIRRTTQSSWGWPAALFGVGSSVLSGAVPLACSSGEFCASESYECTPEAVNGHGGSGDAGSTAGGEGGAPTAEGGAAGARIGAGGAPDAGAAGRDDSAPDAGAAGSASPPDNTCTENSPADGCALADDTGIYVDPSSGNDAALGTRGAPLASAEKALRMASDLGKPVYLCNAEYDEHVTATDAAVALRGGYTCPGDERGAWVYADGTSATIRATTPGIVLSVRDVSEFAVSDVAIYAADADEAGGSSVAAFVASSTGVTFTRVVLRAGKGKDGADAELVPFTLPSPEELNGNGMDDNPNLAKECACPAGDKTVGGAAGINAGPGGTGEPLWGGENGSELGSCDGSASGGRGGDAPAEPPAEGAQILGQLTMNGWQPATGADGANGRAGQGGGGSAAIPPTSGGTSGGGCGGCGGRGGPGGQGGGGSIALLVRDASVSLHDVALAATDAGEGGDGAAGQPGQAGGLAGTTSPNQCMGGEGGTGADGAPGGGGAGGVSAAALTLNSNVDWDTKTTLSVGVPGGGGRGGVPGVNDGINGRSRKQLILDPA